MIQSNTKLLGGSVFAFRDLICGHFIFSNFIGKGMIPGLAVPRRCFGRCHRMHFGVEQNYPGP